MPSKFCRERSAKRNLSSRPGEYPKPCREFCGAGHYAMRSEMKVVPRDQFPALRTGERGGCAAQYRLAHFVSGKLAVATLICCASGWIAACSRRGDNPPDRVPSYVSWTPETIAAASPETPFAGCFWPSAATIVTVRKVSAPRRRLRILRAWTRWPSGSSWRIFELTSDYRERWVRSRIRYPRGMWRM